MMRFNTYFVRQIVSISKQLVLCLLFIAALLFALLALVGCSGSSDQSGGRYTETDATLVQKQYLIDNATRTGVITTPSGLQYEILQGASGQTPKATDTVTVHYVGTLIDGTEFDSSYSRNEPATFPLNKTIEGWVEGVQLMSVGSHYRFVVPAELGYGNRGAGSKIKPGDTLVFSIELLSIQ